ncbi:MAG: LysR family transcriptional regulator substrate-binding protein [Clostridium sp.]
MLTPEGEIVLKYARRIKALYGKMETEIDNSRKQLTKVRIGITHTSESNLITEVLARCSNADNNFSITIITDTINNLYDMLDNYEIDLAVVDGTPTGHSLCSLMLATDYLVCVMSIRHPLAKRAMVTLSELKQERMILRLPTSDTRMLFESTLKSIGDSIDNFNITLEVDKLLLSGSGTKGTGCIHPPSACAREQKKGKMAVLPIENLSMMRETKIVYKKDFTHMDILQEITRVYHETARSYQ